MGYNYVVLMKFKVMARQHMRFRARYSMKGYTEELMQEWPHSFLTHTTSWSYHTILYLSLGQL